MSDPVWIRTSDVYPVHCRGSEVFCVSISDLSHGLLSSPSNSPEHREHAAATGTVPASSCIDRAKSILRTSLIASVVNLPSRHQYNLSDLLQNHPNYYKNHKSNSDSQT